MVAFNQKAQNFAIYPLCLKHQAHKVRISSYVCFCIKFFIYANLQKPKAR